MVQGCAPELPRARGSLGRDGVGCRVRSVGSVAESGLWGGQPCAGRCALGLQARVRFGAACSPTVGAGLTACCWQAPAYS